MVARAARAIAPLFALAALLGGCGPGRQLQLEFVPSASPPGPGVPTIDQIESVDVAVFDQSRCLCADVHDPVKAGCAAPESAFTFSRPHASGTLQSIPDGALAIRALPRDAAGSILPTTADCWCLPANSPAKILVFTLSSSAMPADPNGLNCPPHG